MRKNKYHHYRVVQRDKNTEAEKNQLKQESTKKITCLTALMFCTSVFLSFTLGYLIGSKE